MAEVRLRFGRGAYKCLKLSYLSLLDKEGKPVLNSFYVAALVHSPQFYATHNTRVARDQGAGSTCRVRLQTQGNSSDSLKSPLDVLTEAIFGNIRSGCTDLGIKSDVVTQVHASSCLKTHVQRPLLCGSAGINHPFKGRSIYAQTPNGRLGHCTSFTRAYSRKQNYNDSAEPLYKSKSAYYDILGVSPTATHAQIKTAYYKQSFVYHPDRNAGSDEATFRFSQISEAYNVLGNKALRRKYDRGILSQADLQESGRESAAPSSGQKTRVRHSPSVGVNQEKIFDFDAFIRAHYGEQLQREKELRQRREKILRKQKSQYDDVKLGRMKEVAVGVLLVLAMTIVFSMRSSN